MKCSEKKNENTTLWYIVNYCNKDEQCSLPKGQYSREKIIYVSLDCQKSWFEVPDKWITDQCLEKHGRIIAANWV